ncbi:MAG: 30S ribosomal protein S8 [Candidatus Shapirobacteria bacterium]
MTDGVADFLTRIRNGYQAGLTEVRVPYSRLKEALAKVLVKYGFLTKSAVETTNKKRDLNLTLKYLGRQPAARGIVMISKPGRRVYKKVGQIPFVKRGRGVTLVSTSKGVMADREAREQKVGGEVIGQVW